MRTLYPILVAILLPFAGFSARHHVTQTGAGTMDGTDWTNAFPGASLQTVINNAQAGDEVWVACGTYFPTTGTDRTISFSMKNGVSIYGGFIGTEATLDQRNKACHCSVLSGNIGDPGSGLDNSYHVVSNMNLDATAILDGFLLTLARDDRPATGNEGLGGAVYNNGSGNGVICSPTFRNCVMAASYADFGGGVFNNGSLGGVSSPTLINCIIAGNTANSGGGGIDNFGLAGTANPVMINCLVVNNTAPIAGGMYCWGGNPGGQCSPQLINCTFYGNIATDGDAGAIMADNANAGPGSDGQSNPTLINTILWGNTATQAGPQFFCKGTATLTASWSDIDLTGQVAPHVITGATGIISADPLFLNAPAPGGTDDCWYTNDDGFSLSENSPCINTGFMAIEPQFDILDLPRTAGASTDMGPYEYAYFGLSEEALLFKIFPNPASETLIIESSVARQMQLLSLNGELIRSFTASANSTAVSLTGIASGCYLLSSDSGQRELVIVK